MTDVIEQGARAAAQRLTTPHTPELADDVEVALAARDATHTPDQYSDPVAIGSLVVSVASLVWMVYNDIRSRSAASATADAVARRVRQRLDQAEATPAPPLDPAERDRIIDITVEETLNAARAQDPGSA
ncbi:hypothetical protein [Streptomyces sp. SID3212]|uniref:hypothetical protein n=1 Tax=Streptomyces sp. SID3212 TaxID=2690259 RepID=UPI001369DF3F|nr:hypothetical protein [Streptomyces sp. SID3212]MYV55431.1 hypothetical protein [Streptomyces sp. SID3212]